MRRFEQVAGVLALLAGGAHLAAGPAHWRSGAVAGSAAVAVSLSQAVLGLVFLTRGTSSAWPWQRARRPLAAAGLAACAGGGALAVVAWAGWGPPVVDAAAAACFAVLCLSTPAP